jgi:hypothetical protein
MYMNSSIEIMICYAHEDESLMNDLEFQLKFLEQKGHFTLWNNRMVRAGIDWQQEQTTHLNSASIILLLISANFLSSKQNVKVIERAMERHRAGDAKVIPVILRPTMWKSSVLGQLKALPKDGVPITSWRNRDEAFMNVAEGVLQIVEELQNSLEKQDIQQESKEVQDMQSNSANSVFLCYNGEDRPEVKEIGQRLIQAGIKPWLDEWELRPGLPWQRALEKEITTIKSVAVFIGKNGIGPWQQMELEAFLREFVDRDCPVIPVLLADAPDKPALPLFLKAMTWVDFRKSEPDPMKQLIWGVLDKKPDVAHSNNNSPSSSAAPSSSAGTAKANTLSFPKKTELVDLLLACSCMQNRDSRQTVLDLLNGQISGIANSIARKPYNKTDVLEIVSTCTAHPGAIQELVNIVAYLEGETSINTQNLKAFVLKNGL